MSNHGVYIYGYISLYTFRQSSFCPNLRWGVLNVSRLLVKYGRRHKRFSDVNKNHLDLNLKFDPKLTIFST